jgi:hypothetical protein
MAFYNFYDIVLRFKKCSPVIWTISPFSLLWYRFRQLFFDLPTVDCDNFDTHAKQQTSPQPTAGEIRDVS